MSKQQAMQAAEQFVRAALAQDSTQKVTAALVRNVAMKVSKVIPVTRVNKSRQQG